MSNVRPPDPGGTARDSSNLNKKLSNVDMSDVNLNLTHDARYAIEKKEPGVKRKRQSSPSIYVETVMVPKFKFLVLKRVNGESMAKVSPFLIDKLLTNTAGSKSIKNAKKLRDGSMLVETHTYEQAQKLFDKLSDNQLLPVTVEPHKTLNKVKGVITCFDLDCVDITEIKEQLRDQGVEDVIRINRRTNNIVTPTHSYIVVFALTSLPEKLKIGYLRISVRPYLPLPFRCHNCHKFNHSKASCRSVARCAGCGGPVHDEVCQKTQCVNCNGNHSSTDRNCPIWNIEKKILEIKTIEKISYAEAKNKLKLEQPAVLPTSFSNVLKFKSDSLEHETKKGKMKDQGTQCEMKDQGTQCEMNESLLQCEMSESLRQCEMNESLLPDVNLKPKTQARPKNTSLTASPTALNDIKHHNDVIRQKELTTISPVDMEILWSNQWDSLTEEESVTSSHSDKKAEQPPKNFTSKKKNKLKTKKK